MRRQGHSAIYPVRSFNVQLTAIHSSLLDTETNYGLRMMQYVGIGNQQPLLQKGKPEFRCFVDVIQKHLGRDVDLLGLLLTIKRNGLISEEMFASLEHKVINSTIQVREFLPLIYFGLSFERFCFVLKENGYTNISEELRFERFTILYQKPSQKEMPHSKRTHDYYKTLKSCVDNDSFKCDRRVQLRKFIESQDEKLALGVNISYPDRQFAMERKTAATVLLIQQYKGHKERKTILNQAVATESFGTDNMSMQIIYHSKMALTEAQEGNVDKAEDHIIETKRLCQMVSPCFALSSALHDIQYTYKVLYFRDPSQDLLDKILTEGDTAMQSLHNEKEDIQNLWKRIMLLYMVLSLLFIPSDFDVSDISKIKKIKKEQAKHILKEINRCSGDIELRRNMILSLCLAVINEEEDIDAAEAYIKRSLDAAEKGGCFRDIERQNIEKYRDRIERKKRLYNLYDYMIALLLSARLFLLVGLCTVLIYLYQYLSY